MTLRPPRSKVPDWQSDLRADCSPVAVMAAPTRVGWHDFTSQSIDGDEQSSCDKKCERNAGKPLRTTNTPVGLVGGANRGVGKEHS